MNSAGDAESPLMLSVSGARGIVGRSMTPIVAMQFAAAYGTHLRERLRRDGSPERSTTIVLGRDTRPSGVMLADAARAGLLAVGCDVIDLGVVMTPTVGVMIQHTRASGGMVITASHNPLPWNGLKCLGVDGAAPSAAQAAAIIERHRGGGFEFVDAEHQFRSRVDKTAHKVHIDRVLRVIDAEPIRRARLRVVLDSVNGAGCTAGKMLLDSLGCDLIHINGEPTGRFAHMPEPAEANLEQLRNLTAHEHADIGFAQDPDGDRLAIVDERGHYVGEEYTLALAAMQWLEQTSKGHQVKSSTRGEEAAPRGTKCVAANLSTSHMIDDVAARHGATVIRTPVGEGNVVAGMQQHQAIIGGEGNGGVILPPVCWVRDSLSAMALILSLIARMRASERCTPSAGRAERIDTTSSAPRRTAAPSLSSIIDALPRYAMIKKSFDVKSVEGSEAIQVTLAKVASHYMTASVTTSDGVRIDFAPRSAGDGREPGKFGTGASWVHLRASNTEPIMRLIAEAPTRDQALQLIEEVAVVAGLR